MNDAWECPRCKTINAPFNNSCNCREEVKYNYPYGTGIPYDPASSLCEICKVKHYHSIGCPVVFFNGVKYERN